MVVFSYIKGDRVYGSQVDFYQAKSTFGDITRICDVLAKRLIQEDSDVISECKELEGLTGVKLRQCLTKMLFYNVTRFNTDDSETYFCMHRYPLEEWYKHFRSVAFGRNTTVNHYHVDLISCKKSASY